MPEQILVQADSLPLPRETVSYEDTWLQLLRDTVDGQVVSLAESEKTTADLDDDRPVFHNRQLEYYEPSRIVCQLGIVDAAPRYLTYTEKQLLRALPSRLLSRGLTHLATRLRSRSPERAYVSPSAFERNLCEYITRASRCGTEQVVLIKILTASETYNSKNPPAAAAIRRYNDRIDTVADNEPVVTVMRPFADTRAAETTLVEEHTLEDGYHLNATGHARLFSRLESRLNRRLVREG